MWAVLNFVPDDLGVLGAFPELACVRAEHLAQILEAVARNLTVGHTRKVKDRLCCLHGGVQCRPVTRRGSFSDAVHAEELTNLLFDVKRRAVYIRASLLGQWAERHPLLEDLGVITLNWNQLCHRLARNHADFLDIGHHAVCHVRVDLIRSVVRDRRSDDVRLHSQPLAGHAGNSVGHIAEDLPVASSLPRRVDRSVKGVDERVHVRRGQVVLLVPGSRREDDV